MKRVDLERHLRDHGCEPLRQGSRHEVWINLATERTTAVPRHREVKPGTVRAICRDLKVGLPSSVT